MRSVETISNNKIKEIIKLHQKKYREETKLFIAEGIKILEELFSIKADIKEIYAIKDIKVNGKQIPAQIIDEAVMKKISTTDSPCEVITIAKEKHYNIQDFSKYKRLILLDSISDPGNLGTIIRSASAFGVEGLILYGNCVEIYSPKVIRSTAGNLFKIPFITINEKEELQKYFKSHKKIATSLAKTNNITLEECAKLDKYILMLGSEAKGLSKDLTDISDKNIRLDMKNNVESLNLSVSASIIMYELFKYSK